MNNLYGKFSQFKEQNLMTRTRWSEKRLEHEAGTEESMVGPFFNYKIPRKAPPITANFLWGCYITSYARISLYEKLEMVHKNGGRLLYSDTDSVMFSGNKPLKHLNLGKNLGQLDHEKYDLAVFRQSKGYLLCDKEGKDYVIKKAACKGVPTHSAFDFITAGRADFQKPFRLKEALVRLSAKSNKNKPDLLAKIGVNVWDDVHKIMRGVYIKRKGDMGVTYPIDVKEIEAAEESAFDKQESFKEALGGINIRPTAKDDKFRNIVVPKRWLRKTGFEKKNINKAKLLFLKSATAIGVPKGEPWFRGVIISLHSGKYGPYFKLFLTEFCGRNCEAKKIQAGIPTRFFQGFDEDDIFIGKKVEFIMREDYLGRGPFNVKVSLSE
jgi:hypothetical protein